MPVGPQKTQTPPGVGSGIAANFVLAGLGPAIHALGGQSEEWMRGSNPRKRVQSGFMRVRRKSSWQEKFRPDSPWRCGQRD